jgi:uroporphyrin-3 C-methyltransferase
VTVGNLTPSWWQVILARFGQEVRGLLRVSRIDTPEAALLSPDQSFFLRENLKLKLSMPAWFCWRDKASLCKPI